MPTRDPKSDQAPPRRATSSLIFAAAMAVAGASGVAGTAEQAASFGPRVGDIIAFEPGHRNGFDSDARILVNRSGRPACVLNAAMLREFGGSLIMELRRPDRLYRAHWAGPRTSEEATDCGRDADLLMSASDIGALASAAGGFGVNPGQTSKWKRLP